MKVSTRALRDKRAMVASEISNEEAMGFNLWLVIFLGLMPACSLFTGLSVASGFQSAADLSVIGTLLAAVFVTGYLAKRRADEISKETSADARVLTAASPEGRRPAR
jgi:hypothetical protein